MVPRCLESASQITLQKGTRIFTAGDPCRAFYYLLEGSIRVNLLSRSGKSIMLYRFGANETCILTSCCLMSGDDYAAEAYAEEDIKALMLSHDEFQTQLAHSAEFREIVFAAFSHRLAGIMNKLDDVAFSSLDARLAHRLIEIGGEKTTLSITHEQLALDLGSAREVISRRLALWEKDGLIHRDRGEIKLLEPALIKNMLRLGD